MKDWDLKVKQLFIEISEKIQTAEGIIKDNDPSDEFYLEDSEKIQFPRRFIRSAEYFRVEYRLNFLIGNKILVDNIAYSMQLTDVFNYFINRFNISLSAGRLFRKIAIIHCLSVLEAMLYGVVAKQNAYCRNGDNTVCRRNERCKFYFKSPRKLNFNQVIELFRKSNFIEIADDDVNDLIKIKELRDNIHIWEAKENDFRNTEYSMDSYNKIVTISKQMSEDLPIKVFQFSRERKKHCSK